MRKLMLVVSVLYILVLVFSLVEGLRLTPQKGLGLTYVEEVNIEVRQIMKIYEMYDTASYANTREILGSKLSGELYTEVFGSRYSEIDGANIQPRVTVEGVGVKGEKGSEEYRVVYTLGVERGVLDIRKENGLITSIEKVV